MSLVLKVYSTKKVIQRMHAWARDNLAAKPQLTERAKKLGSYTEREFSEADRENFLLFSLLGKIINLLQNKKKLGNKNHNS